MVRQVGALQGRGRADGSRRLRLTRRVTSGSGVRGAAGQLPVRPYEVARVARGIALQVVLVLGLGLPERAGRGELGHDLAWPQAGGVDVGDRVLGDPALVVVGVEDRRAIARADVVALTVPRARIVDLEEELEQIAERLLLRVEGDLDRLGVSPMVAVGRVGDVTAGVADRASRSPPSACGSDPACPRSIRPPGQRARWSHS